MSRNPESVKRHRANQLEKERSRRKALTDKAEATLRSLLRTPKTRAGLEAAVVAVGVSRRFVFGWLSEATRTGLVATIKTCDPWMYQLSSWLAKETAKASLYPSWLDPRILPDVASRAVYLDGRPIESQEQDQEEDSK